MLFPEAGSTKEDAEVGRRIVLVLALLAVAATGALAKQKDIGIGVEYVFSYAPLGVLNGFAITGSPPVLPIVFGLNLSFGGGSFNLGVTGDWWLFQRGLTGPLALYAGPGLFLTAGLGASAAVAFGARGIVGLQLFPIEPLEFFIETGVNVGIAISGAGAGLSWGIPFALGGRFWF
jgi:hypothetical protein